MANPRTIRRLAMQALYQIDLTGEADPAKLIEQLDEDFDPLEARERAVKIAAAAWAEREQTDQRINAVAEDWPVHRQPPVDRAILRLACYEMASGITPVKVAINEAIELAKSYGAEQSPAFVNGVLDKIGKTVTPPENPAAEPLAPESADAWLRDAMGEG